MPGKSVISIHRKDRHRQKLLVPFHRVNPRLRGKKVKAKFSPRAPRGDSLTICAMCACAEMVLSKVWSIPRQLGNSTQPPAGPRASATLYPGPFWISHCSGSLCFWSPPQTCLPVCGWWEGSLTLWLYPLFHSPPPPSPLATLGWCRLVSSAA